MAKMFVLSIERVSWDALIGFVIGFFFAILLAVSFLLLSLNKFNLYDLDHWKLNIEVPFESMWMNMGYWYAFSPCFSSLVTISPFCECLIIFKKENMRRTSNISLQ